MPYTSNGVIASLTAFHINGLPTGTLGYFEDGVVTTQNTIMGAVEELKVVSTVPPAEYGHAAGGFDAPEVFRQIPQRADLPRPHDAGRLFPALSRSLRERPRVYSKALQREEQDLLHVHAPEAAGDTIPPDAVHGTGCGHVERSLLV